MLRVKGSVEKVSKSETVDKSNGHLNDSTVGSNKSTSSENNIKVRKNKMNSTDSENGEEKKIDNELLSNDEEISGPGKQERSYADVVATRKRKTAEKTNNVVRFSI